MAERLAALAGYNNQANSDSDYSISQSVNANHFQLDQSETQSPLKSDIDPPVRNKPLQRRKTEVGVTRSEHPVQEQQQQQQQQQTPNSKNNKDAETALPDTERRPDNRKSFGVRITNDDRDDKGQRVNDRRIPSGATGGAKRVPSTSIQPEDTMDETQNTDFELREIQRDFSMGQDTASFGDSLLGQENDHYSDNHTGRRRSNVGQTVKTSTERINNLIKERDDLKIELDYHRRKMSVEDQGHEIISLTRIVHSNKVKISELTNLLTRSDIAVKAMNKENKRLKKEREGESGELMEENRRLKEENEQLKMREREKVKAFGNEQDQEIQSLRGEISNLQSDHQAELHQLNLDKDTLGEDLDQAKDEIEDLKQQLQDSEAAKGDRGEVESELERMREEAKEDKHEIQSANAEIVKLNNLLERNEDDRRTLVDENDSLREAVDELKKRIDKVGEVSMENEESRREEINTLQDQLTAADIEMESLKGQIDDLKADQYEQLRVREDLEEKIEALNEDFRTVEDSYLLEKEKAGNLENENQALDGDLAALEEKHQIVEQTLAEVTEDREQLLAEYEELKALLTEKEEDLAETNRELGESSNARLELEGIIEVKEKENRTLKSESAYAEEHHEHRYSLITKTNSDLQLRLRELEEELSNKSDELRQAEQRLKEQKVDSDTLAKTNEQLYTDLRAEEDLREELEEQLQDEKRRYEKELDNKDEEIQHALSDLQSRSKELEICKQDLAAVQEALRKIENDTAKLGQSQANDKHSLDLEIDRLKRDIGRVEEELEKTKKELERKEESCRNKDKEIEQMYTENRNMSSKLASETQARLGLDERFEVQAKAHKAAQEEVDALKAKIEELDEELSRGERTNQHAEQQTSAALSERNTFLMYIYQQLDKIVGADKNTPLRALSKIPSQFEERAKIVEAKFAAEMKGLKRTQEERFRKLDACEKSIKTAILKQSSWRAKVQQKEGECTAKQNTINELNIQISSMRSRLSSSNPDDVQRIKKLTIQIRELERKLAEQEKQVTTESARIRELKIRCEAAEERTRTIEIGGRARVKELSEKNRLLEKEKKDLVQKQLEITQAHNNKIDEVRQNESR